MRQVLAGIIHSILIMMTVFMLAKSATSTLTAPDEPEQPALDAAQIAAQEAENNAAAEAAVAAAKKPKPVTDSNNQKVIFKLPFSTEAKVHAVAVYGAEKSYSKNRWWEDCITPSDQPCTPDSASSDTPRKYIRSINVKVNHSKAPVILLLMAYEPVRWNIQADGSRVEGIILAGYSGQRVSGAGHIPQYSFTHQPAECECYQGNDFFYAMRPDDATLIDKVDRLTGKKISSFQARQYGKNFDIGNAH